MAQTLLVAIIRYRAVVLRLRWPSSNWMVRRSVPASSRCTAKAWRRECGVTGLPMPHCCLHLPAGAIDGERVIGWPGRSPGNSHCSGMGALPIVPEHIEEFGRQHDIAVFAALALLDPDDHALAVDRGGREADGFGDPQAGRVTDGQNHAVLQIVHRAQEARHFLLAQHNRQLFRLTTGGISSSTTQGRLRVTV